MHNKANSVSHPLDLSVVICSHNPRKNYLDRVLAALKAQSLPLDRWELLLVDNASKEPLSKLFDLSWHPHSHHLSAPAVGKTHALLLAVQKFQGELFVIVDDDNLLRSDYLEAAVASSRTYPWLGAWAGSCIPEFESPPPPHLAPHLHGLVIESVDRPYWSNMPRGSEAHPPGAGMVVRRVVAEHWSKLVKTDPLRHRLGHTGAQIGAGEDADMALCSIPLDLGTGRIPELQLTHLIPSRKLTEHYLLDLYRNQAYSSVLIRHLHGPEEGDLVCGFSAWLRCHASCLFWSVFAKSRISRRIRCAMLRARFRAIKDLTSKHSNPGKQHIPVRIKS